MKCMRGARRRSPGLLSAQKLRDDVSSEDRTWREVVRASILVACAFVLGLFAVGAVMDDRVMNAGPSYYASVLATCGALASALAIVRYLISSPLLGEAMDIVLFAALLVLTHVYAWQTSTIRFSSFMVTEELDQMVDDEVQLPGTSIVLHLADLAQFSDVYAWLAVLAGNFACNPDRLRAFPAPGNGTAYTCFVNDDRFLRISPLRVRVQRAKGGVPAGAAPTEELLRFLGLGAMRGDVLETVGLGEVTPESEDRAEWVGGGTPPLRIPWRGGGYTQMGTGRRVHGLPTWGFYQSYALGGYSVDFGPAATEASAAAAVDALEQNGFLDARTRVIVVETHVLRADVGVWALARVTIETPRAGGFHVRKKYRTGQLPVPPPYVGAGSRFARRLVMPWSELFHAMTVLVLALCFSEALAATRDIRAYLGDASNLFDAFTLLLCVVAFGLRAAADYYLPQNLAALGPAGAAGGAALGGAAAGVAVGAPDFPEYDTTAWCGDWTSTAITVALFFLYARILKYLQRVPGLDVIQRTFKRAAGDLGAFAVLFCVVFGAYAAALNLLFGGELRDFRTFVRTLHTLLRALTGDLDAVAMFDAERAVGFAALLTFNMLVVFTLLTLLIAILSDAFIIEKAAIDHLQRKRRVRELTAFVAQTADRHDSAVTALLRLLAATAQRLRSTTRSLLSASALDRPRLHLVLWSARGLRAVDPLSQPDPYVLVHMLPDETAVQSFLERSRSSGTVRSPAPAPPADGRRPAAAAPPGAAGRGGSGGGIALRNVAAAAAAAAKQQDDEPESGGEGGVEPAAAAGSVGAGGEKGLSGAQMWRNLAVARSAAGQLRQSVRRVVVDPEEERRLREPRRVYRSGGRDDTTSPEWHERCEVPLRAVETPCEERRRTGWAVLSVWDLNVGAPDHMLGIAALPLGSLPLDGEPVTADLALQEPGWTPRHGVPGPAGRGWLRVSASLYLPKYSPARANGGIQTISRVLGARAEPRAGGIAAPGRAPEPLPAHFSYGAHPAGPEAARREADEEGGPGAAASDHAVAGPFSLRHERRFSDAASGRGLLQANPLLKHTDLQELL